MISLYKVIALSFVACTILASCGSEETAGSDNKKEGKNDEKVVPTKATNDVERDGIGRFETVEGDENTSHYVCPDRDAGSGSSEKGNCPVCGKAYVHNEKSLFHDQQKKLQRTIQEMTAEEADEYQKSFQEEKPAY